MGHVITTSEEYIDVTDMIKGDSSINTSSAKKLQNNVLILAGKYVFPKTQYFGHKNLSRKFWDVLIPYRATLCTSF